MNKVIMVLIALTLGVLSSAQAGMIELRGGVGLNAADADDFENKAEQVGGSGISADEFDNYNADLFFNIPAFPIGVGLRHEWISQDDSSGGTNFDLEATNFSVLVDWRIIDTGFYIGPLLSIGYPQGKVDFDSPNVDFSDRIESGQPSYGVAAEAGVVLGLFLIGGELGYQSIVLEDLNTGSGNTDVDLTGVYGKLMVGLTFL